MTKKKPIDPVTGVATKKRLAHLAGPPTDEGWAWFTLAMMWCPAWIGMPRHAQRIIERVLLEFHQHGREDNGLLPVTYGQFQKHGVRRELIPEGLIIAMRLGWLDRTSQGAWSSMAELRKPSMYAIPWLPRADGMPPSNRWKDLTAADVRKIISDAKAMLRKKKPWSGVRYQDLVRCPVPALGPASGTKKTPSGPDSLVRRPVLHSIYPSSKDIRPVRLKAKPSRQPPSRQLPCRPKARRRTR